jgi:hypothetical protein
LEVAGSAARIHLNVEHPLGDNPSVPCPGRAGILDSVLKIEQNPRFGSCVALVDEYCPSTQKIAVAFNDEVERRIQKRMAGANEGSQHLALWCDKALLKHDTLVSREYRFADAHQAVAITHWRRDMRHLEASRLTLSHRTPRPLNASRKKDPI